MSKSCEHSYRKLSETKIFCVHCGDIKVAAAEPPYAIPYVPVPCPYPHYPSRPWGIYPRPWYPWTEPTIIYGTVTTGNTTLIDG